MASGSQLAASGLTAYAIPNAQILPSVAANALTVKITHPDGADPSPVRPLYFAIRASSGGAVNTYPIVAPLSIIASNGSTFDTGNSVAFSLWLLLFDDAGTLRPALFKATDINRNAIYPLNEGQPLSATAEGGAGAADSAGVAYAGSAITSKPFRIIGRLVWNSGLATAGAWSVGPDEYPMFLQGGKTPGQVVQRIPVKNTTTLVSNSTTIPYDNTSPQSGEGSALNFWDVALKPTSKANFVDYHAEISVSNHTGSLHMIGALFRDSEASAYVSDVCKINTADDVGRLVLDWRFFPDDLNSHTYKINVGGSSAGTWTVNGVNNAAKLGGPLTTFSVAEELMV